MLVLELSRLLHHLCEIRLLPALNEKNILSFRRRLKSYLFNAACPSLLAIFFVLPLTARGLFMMTILIIGFVVPLSLIFGDVGA